MQIDYDYLKQVLEAFAAAPRPTTDIEELEANGINCESDAFLFHMGILQDKGLVEQPNGERGFGAIRSVDNRISWAAVPLRLTAAGHEFLDGLRNQQAMSVLKQKFMHAGIDTARTVVKTVLEESTKLVVKAIVSGATGS
jgi:hypothetical protein